MSSIVLSAESISRFSPAHVFSEAHQAITSLSFSSSGSHIVSTSLDSSLSLYDAQTATCRCTLYSRSSGASHAVLVHDSHAALYAPTTGRDDAIRLLSFADNRVLAEFHGHRDRITSLKLATSSADGADSFFSASRDGTVRLWDLRDPKCHGLLRLPTPTPASSTTSTTAAAGDISVETDPEGKVAVVARGASVLFYDVRNMSAGPFRTVVQEALGGLTHVDALCFTSDAQRLVHVADDGVRVLDGVSGKVLRVLAVWETRVRGAAANASPDSKFVVAGTDDGGVRVWDMDSGAEVRAWAKVHPGAVRCAAWSPRNALFATACANIALWIPAE
eukprot:ANDGO_01784.mRNA.1 WD repeat-containing protein 82